MKHHHQVLQMLLIVGGVELNPGPKTIIYKNADEMPSLEESVGSLSQQPETTSANAKMLGVITACHSQILSLTMQMDQLSKQQQEDRKIMESLKLEMMELKSSLQDNKFQANQKSQKTTGPTKQLPQSRNHKAKKMGNNKCLQQLQVNNTNWTTVVGSLAGVWENNPVAYNQLQQLGSGGQDPLLRACERGYTELISVLLDQGMDPNTVAYDQYGDSLLHVAAQLGQLALVRVLLAREAFMEQREQFGFTPLIAAARAGQLGAVQLLAEHGANLNATTHDGRTSLYWAASSGHSSVVEYLMEHGADPTIRDKIKGDTAQNVARAEGYKNIANFIAKY